jgi:long-chain acyl-CoA synthetase
VNCPESADTVANDMREIGPTYYFAPPRVLEALLTQVTSAWRTQAAPKRALYRRAMKVAERVGRTPARRDADVGLRDRLLYQLYDVLIYGPLRNALGMSRIRVAYTAGEAIGPDLFVFYRSLGINMKQLYGSTETAVFVCIQPNGQVRADTVGPPVKGVELKITDSGEVLIRSPGLLREYYKNPVATREVKDVDGWYHTGDAGYLDPEGHLKIIDRAKDVGKLADGGLFAPSTSRTSSSSFRTSRNRWPTARAAAGDGAAQHRLRGREQLGGAAQPELRRLHRPCQQAADPRADA